METPFNGNPNYFKLLNEKNDDEDEEIRGVKKRNELLQQLMKDQNEETKLQEQQVRFFSLIMTL